MIKFGGSLSGLMHGVHLKRQGMNVTILEQNCASELSSHNAGIRVDENVIEFLCQNDRTGLYLPLQSKPTSLSVRQHKNIVEVDTGTNMYWINWLFMYRILRANFDGYASKACPSPPSPGAGDGSAAYLTGKRVISLWYSQNCVTLNFIAVNTGRIGSITSDLVIGADGIHSTIRKLVRSPMKRPEKYAGHVAWRCVVPRKALTTPTSEFFTDQVSFDFLGQHCYMICYVIPTDEGDFFLESQLINRVLYQNLAEGSAEEQAVFTSPHGRRHRRTVPQGSVDHHTWDKLRELLIGCMASPFAEVVSVTADSFVTKVSDALCGRASFCGGHVLLVGDALAAYRPHARKATDQAASHCLELSKVW